VAGDQGQVQGRPALEVGGGDEALDSRVADVLGGQGQQLFQIVCVAGLSRVMKPRTLALLCRC
jgi:hypothetical protein